MPGGSWARDCSTSDTTQPAKRWCPSKLHYIGAWLWDQAFHAIAYRHVDAKLAEDQLRIMLDHQLSNGMLPDAVHDEGIVTHISTPIEGTVTKPPIMTWAALKLYEKSGNLDFLNEIYESLTHGHDWWLRENLSSCGLCEYHHPFSSGLDDSPCGMAAMPVVAPDLNTYLYIQMESLARIAALIGLESDLQYTKLAAADWIERDDRGTMERGTGFVRLLARWGSAFRS